MSKREYSTSTGRPNIKNRTLVCLSDVCLHVPVTVSPLTSIGTTLLTMEKNRIGSIIITDQETGRPLGIFTLRDVLCRVAITGISVDRPIDSVMTPNPIAVLGSISLRQAVQEMTRHSLRHLLIVNRAGALTGIVSRTDLFNWMCDSCATTKAKRPLAQQSVSAEIPLRVPREPGLNPPKEED